MYRILNFINQNLHFCLYVLLDGRQIDVYYTFNLFIEKKADKLNLLLTFLQMNKIILRPIFEHYIFLSLLH